MQENEIQKRISLTRREYSVKALSVIGAFRRHVAQGGCTCSSFLL
jgi:hypothetical protein